MKIERLIAFIPALARELGGIEEAIFYQQLHYWMDKGDRDDGFVYKSMEEIENETTLTRRQQDRIRRKLIDKGWIEVKKTHAPNGSPTLHYRCLVDLTLETRAIQRKRTKEIEVKQNTPGDEARKFFDGEPSVVAPIAQALAQKINPQVVAKELVKFHRYWTERNKSGTKQKWELQQTFDVKRRLGTWFRNIVERQQQKRAGAGITI